MRRAGILGGSLVICLAVSDTFADSISAADAIGGAFWKTEVKRAPAKSTPKPNPAAAAPSQAPTPPVAAGASASPPAATAAPQAPAPNKPATAAPVSTKVAKAAPASIEPGSAADKRPAKKWFGAAKVAAALPARAIGGYAKGCLAGGKALAVDGPAWQAMRLSRNRNWGHPKLIALLERFAKELREKEKWPGLLIGDLAQPRGGPMLSGHKSHQLGLDADIWYRPLPDKRMTRKERETAQPLLLAKSDGTEVIAANWNDGFMRNVRRVAKYSEVERIFVHPAIKKKFCEVAGTDRDWLRKVRPLWLHNYHFHVRMGCPSDSPTCVPQKRVVTDGDGCGKEVEDWIKLVSRPKKPAPKPVKPAKPAKPYKPRPPMMLKDLPPECTQVITAADLTPPPQLARPPAIAVPPAVKRDAKAAPR